MLCFKGITDKHIINLNEIFDDYPGRRSIAYLTAIGNNNKSTLYD